jgi:hypothetical protein
MMVFPKGTNHAEAEILNVIEKLQKAGLVAIDHKQVVTYLL